MSPKHRGISFAYFRFGSFYGFCFHLRFRIFDSGGGTRRACPPSPGYSAHRGMPAARARGGAKRSRRANGTRSGHDQIASRAIPFPRNPPRSCIEEQSTHAALLDLGWSVSPRVEDTAADAIVVDLAGLACLFGSGEAIANLLAKRASDLGLIVQIAVSGNLEVALHAARGFPGITVIPPGEEAQWLGALPIQVFSPPAEMIETLERWGVRTCEALAKLPLLELSERLGQQGVQLHQWARGASARSMILAEPKRCFEEEMALEYAVEELEPLAFLLGRLLDQLCARLTARSLGACVIRLRFGLDASSDNESSPFFKSQRVPRQKEKLRKNLYPACAHARFQNAFEAAPSPFAVRSAECPDCAYLFGCRTCSTARDARGIIPALGSRP